MFAALPRDRPINLIRMCCLLLIAPAIVANETFSYAIFVDNRQAHGLVEVQAKILMALSKLRIRHSRECVSSCRSMVDFRVTLVVEELLI
jgi:hypothetical protein